MNDKKDTYLASTQKRVKIVVSDLQIGMYITELDKPWLDSPFLFQDFELVTLADVLAIQNECHFVYIDITKQKKRQKTKLDKKIFPFSPVWISNRIAPPKTKTIKEEFDSAKTVYYNTSNLIMGFMDDVRLGRTLNVTAAKAMVSKCVDSILNTPDALMWMTQLKIKDIYTAQHSLNVCIFSIVLGRQINLSVEQLNQVGLCGMMHDMGKMRIPLNILNKPEKLNSKEFNIMKTHTTHGWKLLMASRNMYGGAVDVAHSHHEKLQGGGYPRNLSAGSITPYTRIVAIADMYDAMTSDRVYKKGMNHLDAINLLTKASNRHLDESLVIKFIECLSIYPPGSVVEMSNGDIAVVLDVMPGKRVRPKIIVLFDGEGHSIPEKVIDLAMLDLESTSNTYRIRKIIRAEDCNINLREYYKRGIISKSFAAK